MKEVIHDQNLSMIPIDLYESLNFNFNVIKLGYDIM